MAQLIIVRHGNTFDPDEEPRRIGHKTDIPLVQSGIEQAEKLAVHLEQNGLTPSEIYSSPLKRAQYTAKVLAQHFKYHDPIHIQAIFNEIDYGPDENKPESEVVARLGQDTIDAWNTKATVPAGWDVDIENIIKNWQKFAEQIRAFNEHSRTLVVTSNGVARFATAIADYSDDFNPSHALKMRTGSYSLLEHDGKHWHVRDWDRRP